MSAASGGGAAKIKSCPSSDTPVASIAFIFTASVPALTVRPSGNLVTSAGTYVKEFVHGDLGRTRPSVGELLGAGGGGGGGGSARVSADILSLDVTDLVEADGDEAGGEEDDEDDE